MKKVIRIFCALAFVFTAVACEFHTADRCTRFRHDAEHTGHSNGPAATVMTCGQLQWFAVPAVSTDAIGLYLYLDPLLGLRDIDFHYVTGDHLKKIKARTPKPSLMLGVTSEVKFQQLLETLDMVHKLGGYDSVVICEHK